jgi:PAS domain-containing protein
MNASGSRPAHAHTAERRPILVAIPPIAWCKLPDGSNEFVRNQRWQDYTGIPADEARGQGWQAAVHPEDLPKLIEKWVEIVASGTEARSESDRQLPSGATARRTEHINRSSICQCPRAAELGRFPS